MSLPVVCSWCQLYRPGQAARVLGYNATGGHGICPDCRRQWMLEVAKDAETPSPCCGVVGKLLERQSESGLAIWRQCPCGHIYIARLKTQKG